MKKTSLRIILPCERSQANCGFLGYLHGSISVMVDNNGLYFKKQPY